MRHHTHTALLVAAATLAACNRGTPPLNSPPVPPPKPVGVLAATADSMALDLFALNPVPYAREAGAVGTQDPELFHGYRVLGSASLADRADRNALMYLVERGIESSDGRVAGCFDPRHGISVTVGGRTTDFVICFECLQIVVFEGETCVARHLTSDRDSITVTQWFERNGLTIQKDE